MGAYARVAFTSPLPQLDRLFDYSVPAELRDSITIGQLVKVPFGRSKHLQSAFVVEVTDSSEYGGQVADIAQIETNFQLLPDDLYRLIRLVADRAALTFGDVAKIAIPDRMVRVESLWLKSNPNLHHEAVSSAAKVLAHLAEPYLIDTQVGSVPGWMHRATDIAREGLRDKRSSILVVPDFRDVERLASHLASLDPDAKVVRYLPGSTKSERFVAYLEALESEPTVVIGTRSAIFAPVHNPANIVVVDDASPDLIEQSAPYTLTRDVALLRQSIEKNSLHFVSASRSVAVQRLVNVRYAVEAPSRWKKPNVVFTQDAAQLTSLVRKVIMEGLARGPVLIQVSGLGITKSLFCKSCGERAKCRHCAGYIRVGTSGRLQCPLCSGLNEPYLCSCGSGQLRQGRAGSTRVTAELGRAFGSVRVIESTSLRTVDSVPSAPVIVVATPGCEPIAQNGYAATIIFDADVQISRESLSTTESAWTIWATAMSLNQSDAVTCFCGVSAELGTQLANWDVIGWAKAELAEREDLGFPPAKRLLSITGATKVLEPIAREITESGLAQLVGSVTLGELGERRALFSYQYKNGENLAALLRTTQLRLAGIARQTQSGRASRGVTVKMDDSPIL